MKWLPLFLAVGVLASPLDPGYMREANTQDGCIRLPYKKKSKEAYLLLDLEVVGRPGDKTSRRIDAQSLDSNYLEICNLKPEIYKIWVSECKYKDGIEECDLSDTMFVVFPKKK